jgi:hypothetical protein
MRPDVSVEWQALRCEKEALRNRSNPMHARGDPLPAHRRRELNQLRGVLLRASLLGSNDVGERRGIGLPANESDLT